MSLPRYAARRDSTERDIVQALERFGLQVYRLSQAGMPDLLTWHPAKGEFRLFEVKTKAGKLTKGQQAFKAPYNLLRSVDDVLMLYAPKSRPGATSLDYGCRYCAIVFASPRDRTEHEIEHQMCPKHGRKS